VDSDQPFPWQASLTAEPQFKLLIEGANHALRTPDEEWAVIKPMLPNKPRGVPRVNDRRVLNGIFWVLRSGAPWRDLPGLCHIAVPRARSVGGSGIVRPLRLWSATCPSPRRAACGAFELR
jgi:transposase